jgi:hypothetical protein
MISFYSIYLFISFAVTAQARDVSLFSVFFPEDAKEEHLNKLYSMRTEDSDVNHMRSIMRLGSSDNVDIKGQVKKSFARQDLPVGISKNKGMIQRNRVTGNRKILAKNVPNDKKVSKNKNNVKNQGNFKQQPHRFLKASTGDVKSMVRPNGTLQKQVAPKPGSEFGELESQVESGNREQMPVFDFIVGGFPKCGTTTLLKAFAAHPETDMAASEQCSIASPGQADIVVLRKLDETLDALNPDPSVKRSFKCPTAMYNYKSIIRMEKHSPNAKFIVGIRHPVKMIQSFYNYRVTEIHERNLVDQEPIPAFSDLIESGLSWKGVSLASVRFELFLTQLGKTIITPEDMNELTKQNYELAIKPSNFTVFLYTVDQLEDSDETRSDILRHDLQTYLGLQSQIQPFGHENKNHAVGATGHTQSINICDHEFKHIRDVLVYQGKKSAAWIRDHFIASPEVIIANKKHFVETLSTWSRDPCDEQVA